MGRYINGMDARRARPEVRGAPLWMITWADMMTLLLACFVLMTAFSTMSGLKLREALESLQSAFGVSPDRTAASTVSNTPLSEQVERQARELQRKVQVLGHEDALRLAYVDEGVEILLPDRFFFDAASAAVKPESYPVLQAVAALIANLPECRVDVLGHTDNRALTNASPFRDNYDLSHARADHVARKLQEYGKVPLDRFAIVACGSGHPVATNDTEAGRQANRRVEILVRAARESSRMTALERRVRQSQSPEAQAVP